MLCRLVMTNTVVTYRADGTLVNVFQWEDTKSVWRLVDGYRRYIANRRGTCPAFFDRDIRPGDVTIWARTADYEIPQAHEVAGIRRIYVNHEVC